MVSDTEQNRFDLITRKLQSGEDFFSYLFAVLLMTMILMITIGKIIYNRFSYIMK